MSTTESPAVPLESLLTLIQVHLTRKGELVPGYYAVDGKRYLLDLPKCGKWRGWMFLKTGSDYHCQMRILSRDREGNYRTDTEQGRYVLAKILEAPVDRMREYGEITGTCAVCGRKLECPVSVRFGIGPVCLNRLIES